MAKATTRTRSASRSSSAARTATRWTDEQVKLLLETVQSAPTAKAAFGQVAEKLGKSVGTVQQKYYALQRAEGKGRPRRASGSSRRSTTRTAAKGRSGATTTTTARGSSGRGELGSMSNVELSRLVRDATAELERRMVTLERNVRSLLG